MLRFTLRLPSRSGDPREHDWDLTPTHSHLNFDSRSPGLPRPWCTPGAFPAAVATTESTTGKPSPTPARSRTPPRATQVHPAPAALPARFQLQWGPPRALRDHVCCAVLSHSVVFDSLRPLGL